ncbi:hypothetical protein [Leptolyngbya sp. 7M]|uniref:hypothetical protein n=1 Tax=Leptolyngbya sp. 7M TaxID=2812896 RepID=UPI001B8BAAC2|nr:hypothetical protein [Leptolyngbya sp. 7M]QYO67815.1 hypothetical protein JVX88_14120 [Leptolyngbya sp. 7M]
MRLRSASTLASYNLMNPIPQPKAGYRPQAEDTSVEADVAYYYFLRQKPLTERIKLTQNLMRMAKHLAIASVQRQYPNDSIQAVQLRASHRILADKYTSAFIPGGTLVEWQQQDALTLTQRLHPQFEKLGIAYYLGGGLAAAIWGEPRVTQDADIIVQFQSDQLDRLISTLEAEGFYCPPADVEEVRLGVGKTISITHTQTLDNADLIAMSDEPFERSQMSRRMLIEDLGAPFWVCTAEDIILQKLLWSQRSRSEQQWRQVLGILKAQATVLDYDYLSRWADQIGQVERLTQAFLEAGI